MSSQQAEIKSIGETSSAQEITDAVFSKLKGLSSEASNLFPDGIGSVELEIGLDREESSGFKLTLKVSGAAATGTVRAFAAVVEAEDDSSVTFNAEGHKVIAHIAMNDLQSRVPAVAQKVQQILDDGDRLLTEAAIFPDVIRNDQPETKPFHFIDIPFRDGGPANPALPPAPHVLAKIDDFSTFFTGGGGTAEENVDALSWLIHLFGDVHQPLHCIEHISSLHPDGDRGGNSFRLKGSAKNLHSAWDSSVNVFESKDEEQLALDIAAIHTRQSLASDLQVTVMEQWARSSFKLAKRHAYSIAENPQNPPKPSTAYLKNMEKIGKRQAALAGYRLADHLAAIL